MKKKWKLPLLILGGGILLTILLVVLRSHPPEAEKKSVAVVVKSLQVTPSDIPISLAGYGTVTPKRRLVLRPQVSGHVTDQHHDLFPGGILQPGEIIVQIDPRDYELAVEEQRAAVTRAEFELELEEGNQIVAKREWELLNKSVAKSPLGTDLALRKPHLQEKKAALEAARSRLKQRELDLSRTIIHAPFRALVEEENVEIGQFVSPQGSIMTLVSTEEFYISVSVPEDSLLSLRSIFSSGVEIAVKILFSSGNGQNRSYTGKVARILSEVDSAGRMGTVVISVSDPLNLEKQSGKTPLLLGSYVQVRIPGPIAKNSCTIPVQGLRNRREIWVVNSENRLRFEKIQVFEERGNEVVVECPIKEKERIVISSLPVAIPGLLVEEASSE